MLVITAKTIASVQTVTANIVSLQQDRDMLLNYDGLWYRDCKGLRYWNSYGLRDVHRDGHRIGNLNRYFHWVRDWLLYSVRYWFLYSDGIRLGDVDGIGPVHRYRNWNLDRDRYVLFDCDWVRLWHRDGDFFSDGYCLDVSLVGQSETSAKAVPTEPVVQVAVAIP